jgi:hypothetical protein
MIKIEERKKLLLFGTGSILVEGVYPKYSYAILGTIPLTVKIDASKSDVVIGEVTVKLKRKLEFFSKNNIKSTRSILQNMYEEKKKVCSKTEDLLFNIPFRDSNEIEYYKNSCPLGENVEMCCLIPNVSTNSINVMYYIKVIADPDDLLAKKIEFKMPVDFHSKDENQMNRAIFDNFNDQVKKINSGEANINNLEPYYQYDFANNNFDKRLSSSIYSYQQPMNNQNNYNNIPQNQIKNNNYEQNNYISNNFDDYYKNNNNNNYNNN